MEAAPPGNWARRLPAIILNLTPWLAGLAGQSKEFSESAALLPPLSNPAQRPAHNNPESLTQPGRAN